MGKFSKGVKMSIIGLDIGYYATKDHTGRIHQSAISKKENSLANNKIQIDGVGYTVGQGNMTSEMDKTDSDINKVLTLYNLALSKAPEPLLVVGLPVAQYETQKQKLFESIMNYNRSKVVYKRNEFKVNIIDVIVAPQGIAALYLLPNLYGEYIVIDIGGGTLDIAYLEFDITGIRIIMFDTWYKGVRTVYSDIIKEVNNTHELKLSNSQAEKILRDGLYIEGTKQDLSFLKPILQEYVDNIVDEIKIKYPYRTTPIYLVGGGAELLYNPLTKRFPKVTKLPNPQFANALGYYVMGTVKFAERGYRI